MSVPIKLVRVNDGRRYIYISESAGTYHTSPTRVIVLVKGEVLSHAGCSARHGPDKKFLLTRVGVEEAELTEALMAELEAQGKGAVP